MSGVEERLTELEIRICHQQLVIEQLSDVVAAQGRVVDALRAELEAAKRRLLEIGDDLPSSPAERPPHY